VLAGVARTVADVVVTLAMTIKYFINTEAIFRAYLVVVVSQKPDRAEQHQKGGSFQTGGEMGVVPAGLLH
jgi:hypothetical protein